MHRLELNNVDYANVSDDRSLLSVQLCKKIAVSTIQKRDVLISSHNFLETSPGGFTMIFSGAETLAQLFFELRKAKK